MSTRGPEDMPHRQHEYTAIQITGRITLDKVVADFILIAADGTEYWLRDSTGNSYGAGPLSKLGQFGEFLWQTVTVKGMLDTFQDYGSGTTTVRVIQGARPVDLNGHERDL